MTTEPTKARAVVVETLEPEKPKPLDHWLVYFWNPEDKYWDSEYESTEKEAKEKASSIAKQGLFVRILHVTDKPADPDKGLRELLEWMNGPSGLDDGHIENIIRKEIGWRLEKPHGDD